MQNSTALEIVKIDAPGKLSPESFGAPLDDIARVEIKVAVVRDQDRPSLQDAYDFLNARGFDLMKVSVIDAERNRGARYATALFSRR